jgi:hypothetical protein
VFRRGCMLYELEFARVLENAELEPPPPPLPTRGRGESGGLNK